MSNISNVDETLFFITKEDAQTAAKQLIGRRLTRTELKRVAGNLYKGLNEWPDILKMAIQLTVK